MDKQENFTVAPENLRKENPRQDKKQIYVDTINKIIDSSSEHNFWIKNVSLSQNGSLIKLNYENIMDFYNMNFSLTSNPDKQSLDYHRQEQNINNLLNNNTLNKKEYSANSFKTNNDILSLIFDINREETTRQANVIVDAIKKSIPENLNEIEKIKFLSDYLRFSFRYDTDFFNYAASTGSDCSYKIKDGIVNGSNSPSNDASQQQISEINTALVCNNGVCREISFIFNGLCINNGIKSDCVECNYNNIRHIINLVTLSDGTKSFVDVTRIIRGDLNIENCFLVDRETLEDHGYDFNNTKVDQSDILEVNDRQIKTKTILNREEITNLEQSPPYNIKEIILSVVKTKKENNCYLNPVEEELVKS